MQIRSVLVHLYSTGYITLNLPHSFTGVASYTPLLPTKKNLKNPAVLNRLIVLFISIDGRKIKKKNKKKVRIFF